LKTREVSAAVNVSTLPVVTDVACPEWILLVKCPSGYQRIGQGHCLATISSGLYPGFRSYERPNLGGIPTYPIVEGGGEYASQSLNSDKIISTEGCFSCKINGRHRRNLNHTDGHGKKKKKKGDNRKRRHEHGFEPRTSITIHLDQTKHRSQIIKLQSAIKNDFEYYIEKGNEQGQFEMNKRHGVWRLHFRKRIKTPRVFNLIVNSRLIQNHSEDTKELNQHGKELNQHGKELSQHGKELSQGEKESNHHGKELSENEIERNELAQVLTMQWLTRIQDKPKHG
ncbi:fibrillin-1-like, partial [Diaphorina citri]|uniref:Fibrillin-1-like n=1 Tax=Diaphorina citri TaxID=121845 RepID=A0A3Q0JLT3_DIACI